MESVRELKQKLQNSFGKDEETRLKLIAKIDEENKQLDKIRK